jgi:hypothetical protein
VGTDRISQHPYSLFRVGKIAAKQEQENPGEQGETGRCEQWSEPVRDAWRFPAVENSRIRGPHRRQQSKSDPYEDHHDPGPQEPLFHAFRPRIHQECEYPFAQDNSSTLLYGNPAEKFTGIPYRYRSDRTRSSMYPQEDRKAESHSR